MQPGLPLPEGGGDQPACLPSRLPPLPAALLQSTEYGEQREAPGGACRADVNDSGDGSWGAGSPRDGTGEPPRLSWTLR